MPPYPPYQHPFLDVKTRLVTKPWQLFFLQLAGGTGSGAGTGPVTLAQLAPLSGAPRLLGRGSAGPGPVEELTIGDGLEMVGTELRATAVDTMGYWTPITNGDPLSPELLFDAEGDCVVGWVPTR